MLRFFNRLGLKPGKSFEQWVEQTRSPSGFEREAAIHALRSHREGAAISCLLVRANDWVPAVRDAAVRALGDFLTDEFAGDWMSALESLTALQRARRTNHDRLLSAVANLLGKPQHRSAVLSAAAQGSHAVKRYVFELQCHQTLDDEPRVHLLVNAVSGGDLPIARRALALSTGEMSDRVAHAACKSRFSELRVAGLRRLLVAAPAAARELARDLCLDRSGGVRSAALFALRSWQEEHLVVASAMAQLNDADVPARSRAVALQVLGDLCPGEVRDHCEEAVHSASGTLRCVGYSLLLAAATEDQKEPLILRALADHSSRVQRLAVESVRRGACPPQSDAVLNIALRHGTESAVHRAVSLFRYYSYWTRLVALLRGLDEQALLAGRTVWLQALGRWEMDGTRNFVTPNASQQREIERLWKRCGPLVPHGLRKQISFHLSTYGLNTE